jgi:hypothetical protein
VALPNQVHSESYLNSLQSSEKVARIVEVLLHSEYFTVRSVVSYEPAKSAHEIIYCLMDSMMVSEELDHLHIFSITN